MKEREMEKRVTKLGKMCVTEGEWKSNFSGWHNTIARRRWREMTYVKVCVMWHSSQSEIFGKSQKTSWARAQDFHTQTCKVKKENDLVLKTALFCHSPHFSLLQLFHFFMCVYVCVCVFQELELNQSTPPNDFMVSYKLDFRPAGVQKRLKCYFIHLSLRLMESTPPWHHSWQRYDVSNFCFKILGTCFNNCLSQVPWGWNSFINQIQVNNKLLILRL